MKLVGNLFNTFQMLSCNEPKHVMALEQHFFALVPNVTYAESDFCLIMMPKSDFRQRSSSANA